MAPVELQCVERLPITDEVSRLQCHVLVLQLLAMLPRRLDGTLKVALCNNERSFTS